MEANCDDFIQLLESSSSDSSEFEENHEIYKGDGYNFNDNRNRISNFMTTPKRLVCYSNTSDDESSDHLRSHTPLMRILLSFLLPPTMNHL
ncbi:hypothetical protein AVEN_166777-1 [Araneus ventricosus]|uniref:Uncharacterized protein n=1 Tax=Araneus ventricosus TaxID=182803 RepID=A0A4Y2BPV8_ARAVE|nr:hypothetical protein AVEN_166777-1 [Araneus ventricosus]